MTEFGPARLIPYRPRGCALHKAHDPTPLILQQHHVFPKYLQAQAYGIPERELLLDARFDSETVDVCGTGHDSIHDIIRRMLDAQKQLPKRPAEIIFAREAIDRYQHARFPKKGD